MMAPMICPHCGAANGQGVRFCGRCGTPFQAVAAAPSVAAIPVAAPPSVAAIPVAAPPPVTVPAGATAPAGDGLFCGRCGASNASGAQFCRRCGQPLHLAAPTMAAGAPAYAVAQAPAAQAFPAATQAQVAQMAPRKAGRRRPWGALVGVVGVAAIALAVVSQVVIQHPSPPCGVSCPPQPPRPAPPLGPAGPPLPPQHRYTSRALGFSLEYPDGMDPSTNDSQTIDWSGQGGDGGAILITAHGEAANGRSPQQLVQALQQSQLGGNATLVFTIPNAELGYTLGYGAVYDALVSPQGGQQQDMRVIIEAAVRNGTAVEMITSSPFTPDKSSHAAPAQLEPAAESTTDQLGNTVTWTNEAQL